MTTAVFIGTFDPFHGGHVGQLLRAHHVMQFSKVLILVDKNPPHKPNASSWEHRLEMVKLTLQCITLPFAYSVQAVESSLASEIDEVIEYKITGIDSYIENITDPARWDYITRWPMIVLSIPGIDIAELDLAIQVAPKDLQGYLTYTYISEDDAPNMNYDFSTKAINPKRVHAADVRAGMSTSFLAPQVQEYIQLNKLY